MPTSDARIKANQANALHSTGPRTQAGREKSRANACTHYMTAKVVLDDADAAEVERRAEVLTREMAPKTELGSILLRKVAVKSVISELASRAEFAASAERVRHAAERFDEARRARATALLEAIHDDPRGHLRQLRAMPEGVELMLDHWRGLRAVLTRPGESSWDAGHLTRASNLFGIPEEDARYSRLGVLSRAVWADFAGLAESEGGDLGAEGRQAWARTQILWEIDESIAELEEHLDTLDTDVIAVDRAESGARALFDGSKEGTLLRRYESEASRGFYKALKEFREVEAEAAATPAEPSSSKAPSELGSFRDEEPPKPGPKAEAPKTVPSVPAEPVQWIVNRQGQPMAIPVKPNPAV